MAINEKQLGKLAMSGAIAGPVTYYLLKILIMPVLNMLADIVPTLGIKLANPGAIEVSIRESLTGISAGLANWLAATLGVTVPGTTAGFLLTSAAGGALFFVAGGYLADALGLLKGNAQQKTARTIFTGSVIVALVMGTIALPPEIGLTLLNVLIAFGVNAYILSKLYEMIDPDGKVGLIPY